MYIRIKSTDKITRGEETPYSIDNYLTKNNVANISVAVSHLHGKLIMGKIFVFDLGNVIVRPMNVKMLYEMLECKVSYEEFCKYFKKDKSVDDVHRGLISTEEHIKKIFKLLY